MATRKHRPKGAPARSAGRSAGGRGALHALLVIFSIVAIALTVLAPSALILLFVAMVPTAVAVFIDRDPQKYASVSVAAMNFTGLTPYLTSFVFGDPSFGRAVELISNVFVLVVIYGAAATGWALVLALPPVTAIILGVITDSRIQGLRKDREQLVEEWGEDVVVR